MAAFLTFSAIISCLSMALALVCVTGFQEYEPRNFRGSTFQGFEDDQPRIFQGFRNYEPRKLFNVMSYGAVADGRTDNSKAFVLAWEDACRWNGRSRVWIPRGTFMLDPVVFLGPCNGSMAFLIKGELQATVDPSKFNLDWINFQYVDRLTVKGGGYLNGQGAAAWPYNNCACRRLPITMAFDFVTNSRVNHLKSVNSKNTHFKLFACENVTMSNIRITAPSDSPNTDGIQIGNSTNVKINSTVIGTGDDCISMISGSRNIDISGVRCGPGHGISIGSLGSPPNEPKSLLSEEVTSVTVRNSVLRGTQNGLRIKTWPTSFPGMASDIWFQNIVMEDVNNPIFIDQRYCPRNICDNKAQSGVQVRNVTFVNVRGTSSSQEAVKIQCSSRVPCQNVKLMNIYLNYHGNEGPVTSSCFNVHGVSYGSQLPPGCL